ncbi:MAG TPA: sugar ABC transporter permease [Prolixibacteraceae bacterium]|nr:sugar ABC transporter permease [Prolixibacteraceae bacterium]
MRKTSLKYVLIFLVPSLIGFTVFNIVPILSSLVLAFTKWDLLTPLEFVGINNFIHMFTKDPIFWPSLGRTLLYSSMSIPLGIFTSLILALAMNRPLKGIAIFRVIYFVPYVSSMIAVSMVWKWLYNDQFGLINTFLSFLGLQPQSWLSNATLVIPSLVIMDVWKGAGFGMLIYLAALQGIPEQLYEAATVDGANAFQSFFKITLPLLGPAHFYMLVTGLINGFQVFDSVYLMTQGGPGFASRVFAYNLYQSAFRQFQMGYASSMAWFLFFIIFAVTLLQFKRLGGKVEYDVI